MSDAKMTNVPFNCQGCGADFELYHDGVTAQTDDSTFAHALPSNLRIIEP